jgi:hypothetical protein
MIELDTPDQDPLNQLIEATEHKRSLESQLKEVEKFISDIEPVVREQFLQDGTQNLRRNDNTAYLRREFKVKRRDGVSNDAIVGALKSFGYEELVEEKYNYRRLCAVVKEIVEAGEEVPEELSRFIEWKEHIKVIVKK